VTELTEQLSTREKINRLESRDDFDHLLRIPQGRRALLWILEQCGVYQAVFTGDDNVTNFNLGRRDIGLRLIAKLETVGPESYPTLLLTRAKDREQTKGQTHVVDAQAD